MSEIIKVEVSDKELDRSQTNLHLARKNFYDLYPGDVTVTISVVAYNRLETTKLCVESILKYTKDVNFNMQLIQLQRYKENEEKSRYKHPTTDFKQSHAVILDNANFMFMSHLWKQNALY